MSPGPIDTSEVHHSFLAAKQDSIYKALQRLQFRTHFVASEDWPENKETVDTRTLSEFRNVMLPLQRPS